jgi:hypothetical protein
MKIKLVLLLLLLSMTLCYDIMVGSFTRDSFAKNDAKINSALKLVKSEVSNKYNNSNLSVIPVALYSQIVNGINYKLIIGLHDISSGKLDLAHAIVYTGPFSVNYAAESASLTFFQKLPDDTTKTLEEEKFVYLNLAITDYLKLNGNSLSSINSIVSYPNLVYNESYYVVYATLKNQSGNNENQIFVVNYTDEQKFVVAKTIASK